VKIAIGIVLAFTIGVVCRLTSVPLPAPPVLIGALLVLAMSVGYTVTDRFATHREARNRALCGGPNGEPIAKRSKST
jgi:XapX domain-containing protein